MNKIRFVLAMLVLLTTLQIAFAPEIDLLGLTLDVKESGIDVDNVNITVEIYDAATGGNLIYNSTNYFVKDGVKINGARYV